MGTTPLNGLRTAKPRSFMINSLCLEHAAAHCLKDQPRQQPFEHNQHLGDSSDMVVQMELGSGGDIWG